jgi:hypothetical protein
LCRSEAYNEALTDNQISKHFDDILFALLVSAKIVVASASSKHLSTTLIRPPQLLVGRTFLKSVLLAECMAPERSMVGVDSIVRAPAYQAEGDDVLVGVEMMRDGLVELDYVSTLHTHDGHCRTYLDR